MFHLRGNFTILKIRPICSPRRLKIILFPGCSGERVQKVKKRFRELSSHCSSRCAR